LFLDIPPDWFMSLAEKNDESEFMMTFMSLIDLREEAIRDVNPNFVWGQNFHIRRETFFDLRGFHPDIVPHELAQFQGDGETGLTMKLAASGRRADYVGAVAIRHIIPRSRLTLEFVRKRAWYAGVCSAYTKLRRNATESPHSKKMESQKLKLRLRARRRPVESIARILRHARSEGSEFLNHAFAADSSVRDWIQKPDYLDYHYPIAITTP
jgi:hypothetical protein